MATGLGVLVGTGCEAALTKVGKRLFGMEEAPQLHPRLRLAFSPPHPRKLFHAAQFSMIWPHLAKTTLLPGAGMWWCH